ncbi:MAG: hypothetical protein U0324_14185 [Polyangiales bacterium]
MNSSQQPTQRRLVIRAEAVRDLAVSNARRASSAGAGFDMAPNPNILLESTRAR